MIGPSTKTTKWKTCKGCDYLSITVLDGTARMKACIINHCKHPSIATESDGKYQVSFICRGKTIKTPKWCHELTSKQG